MYDFLLSEVWWMETTYVALITAAATLGAAYIGYSYKIKKIYENAENIAKLHEKRKNEHDKLGERQVGLSKEHDSLSKEHGNLSKEHQGIISSISKENSDIINKCDAIKESVSDDKRVLNKINETLIEEKAKQELRYAHLNENHQNLLTNLYGGVDAFKAIEKEFFIINEEKDRLKEEIEKLQTVIAKNSNRIEELKSAKSELSAENIHLQKELKNTIKQYNELLEAYQSINSPPQQERPTSYFMEP
ncbi:MAG: hypothetical protein RR048_00565 [Oscillospiraceae bacterium]